MPKEEYGTPFSAIGAISAGSAVATQAAVTGKTLYVTDYAGSSDLAGATLIIAAGGTTIWEIQLTVTAAGSSWADHQFKIPLSCGLNAALTVTVTGTSVCFANVAGFYL